MISGRQRGVFALLGAAVLLSFAGSAAAVETLDFEIGRVDGDQWSASGIGVEVVLGESGPVGVDVSIDTIQMAAPVGTLRHVTVRCAALSLSATEYRCPRAAARVGQSVLDDKPFAVEIGYRPQTGAIDIHSGDIPLLGQRATIDGIWHSDGWSAKLQAAGLDAPSLHASLAGMIAALAGTELNAGSVTLGAEASAGATGLSISATLAVNNLAVANETGTQATEGLTARAQFEFGANATFGDFDYRLSIEIDDGEAYVQPVFFDFAAPLTVTADGWIHRESGKLSVSNFSYRHAGTLDADGSARLSWTSKPAIDFARVTIGKLTFPAAYRTYVQGFLVGTPLAKLQTGGTVRGSVEMSANRLRAVEIDIENLNADDIEQRLAIYGVHGDVHWHSGERPAGPDSRLSWDGGFFYSTGYGPGTMTLTLAGDNITLDDALRVPVLDGALVVDTFVARDLATQRPALDLDARLEPIGLQRLAAASGWPAFAGTLSGELERLSLRDGVVAVGGALVAHVFDGTVRISELRVEQPFSANRRGFANIELDNLDLGLATAVFSLGRIVGRLDGRIDGLQTVKNQPVAFDARLYTPPDDHSRHRISRRAIDNLSDIGGGGAGLLPGGLRFFDDFGYSRLGINCRLTGDVCQMSGVRPAAAGYYIVEGRGLPRIDVIGHSREVNWRRLVAQIQEALKSGDITTRKPSESQP